MEASELGTIQHAGNRFEARIERTLEHDQDAVWRMLTDSSLLPQWLAPGELSLSKGGAAKLNFPESGTNVESVVTDVQPPRLIEYSWSSPGEPDRPLRWEAIATQDGTRLSLTLRIPDTEDIARTCAGWDAHLEMFAAAMEGVPIKFPFERFKTAREAYRALVP
ncbi:MAG TPA: SRPBCC family protein [Bradyrhizobium sp.]